MAAAGVKRAAGSKETPFHRYSQEYANTERFVFLRLRIDTGASSLAGYTPRPWAPK
jgi:hypothetical protein